MEYMKNGKILKFLVCFLCVVCFGLCFFKINVSALAQDYSFKYIPISDVLVNTTNLASPKIVDNVSVVWGFSYGRVGEDYPYIANNKVFGSITKVELIKNNDDLQLVYYDENINKSLIVWVGKNYLYNMNIQVGVNNTEVFSILGYWLDFNYNQLYISPSDFVTYFVINNEENVLDNDLYFLNSLSLTTNYMSFNTMGYNINSINVSTLSSLVWLYETYGNFSYYGDFIVNNLNYNQMFLYRVSNYIYIDFSYFLNGEYIRQENVVIYNSNVPNQNININLKFLNNVKSNNINNILSIFNVEDDKDLNSWNDFFISILDIPIYYLRSLLGFELFGVNLFLAFTSLFTLALGIYVLSKLLQVIY